MKRDDIKKIVGTCVLWSIIVFAPMWWEKIVFSCIALLAWIEVVG